MQVRDKETGEIKSMKIKDKKAILVQGEIEHTKSEQSVVQKLSHPFLHSVKHTFQTDNKIFFITDFANGGELFYHLQHYKKFSTGLVSSLPVQNQLKM